MPDYRVSVKMVDDDGNVHALAEVASGATAARELIPQLFDRLVRRPGLGMLNLATEEIKIKRINR